MGIHFAGIYSLVFLFLFSPLPAQFPLPDLEPITSQNVEQLTKLAALGRGAIAELALSPDNEILAVGATPGVWIYDAANLDNPPYLLEQTDFVSQIAFGPDSNLLVTLGWNHILRVWDIFTRTVVKEIALKSESEFWDELAFSPDGETVALSNGNRVQLWSIITGSRSGVLETNAQDYFWGLDFSSDGSLLAAGSDLTNKVIVWKVKTQQLLYTLDAQGDSVRNIAFDNEDTFLAASGMSGVIYIWKVQSGEHYRRLESAHYQIGVTQVLFLPAVSTLILAADNGGKIQVWDIQAAALMSTLEGHNQGVTSIAVSSNGINLYSASVDDVILQWDLNSQPYPVKNRIQDYGTAYDGMAFAIASNSLVLAIGTGVDELPFSNRIHLWDLSTGEQIALIQDFRRPREIALTEKLIIGNMSGKIQIWDRDKGEVLDTQAGYTTDFVHPSQIAVSLDETLLAVGSSGYYGHGDYAIQLWSLSENREVALLLGNVDYVDALTFSPDGNYIVFISRNSETEETELKRWDWRSPDVKLLKSGRNENFTNDISFSQDGKQIAFFLDNGVQIMDVSTLQTWRLLEVASGIPISAIRFSPDQDILAVGFRGIPRTIQLLDTQTGQTLLSLSSDEEVAFNRAGTLLLTAGRDGLVRLWGVPSGEQ